jgi:hypothetical protein
VPSGVPPSVLAIARARFKRSLLGYRRSEVDQAIAVRDAALDTVGQTLAAAEESFERQRAEIETQRAELGSRERRIEDLERMTTKLSERLVEREQELRRLRDELARVREEGEARVESLATVVSELDGIRRQARAQATRIRLGALRDAAALAEAMEWLGRRPPEARELLMEALTEALWRIGAEPVDGAGEMVDGASGNGGAWRAPAEVFEGHVEVEIGPLSDFSQLVGFEDAAKSIAATSAISVRRFSEGRATLAVTLAEPVALLRELEERCSLELVVRDVRRDRLVLDVGA